MKTVSYTYLLDYLLVIGYEPSVNLTFSSLLLDKICDICVSVQSGHVVLVVLQAVMVVECGGLSTRHCHLQVTI